MIDQHKIAAWDNPIVNQQDRPTLSAAEMKAAFDANTDQLKIAFNAMIDELVSSIGAQSIGSEAIAGLDGATVRAQIVALMLSKVASTGIKALRIAGDGYLEYTTDGSTWLRAPTFAPVTIDPNGEAKNLIVTFTPAVSVEGIATGESMATMFGKLAAWLTQINTHADRHAAGGADEITPANIGAATDDHDHGNITSDGKIGATPNKIILTDTDGALKAGSAAETKTALGVGTTLLTGASVGVGVQFTVTGSSAYSLFIITMSYGVCFAFRQPTGAIVAWSIVGSAPSTVTARAVITVSGELWTLYSTNVLQHNSAGNHDTTVSNDATHAVNGVVGLI